jgi:glycosyltransferase involved in cell wall biosynthesis
MARISLLCSDLAHGPVYTAWMFAGALKDAHSVELVGPRPQRVWPPLADELEATRLLPGASPLRPNVRRRALESTQGADLLYAFKARAASYGLGLWLRRRHGVPLALHLCDWDGGYFADRELWRRAWYAARAIRNIDSEPYLRLMERRAESADLLTVSTRALQRRFGGRVVRQGVDGVRFSPERFSRAEARERLGVASDASLVVFTGTPALHKGLEDLIAAVRSLPSDLNSQLLIVGNPPDPESAAVLAAGEEAGGVQVHESVPFAVVPWYIAAADVVCAPQRSTAFAEHQLPAKILHWMAMGACILATDVGDASEILGGDPPAGSVVPAGDPIELRDELARLLGDDARRAALGREAKARADRLYSWPAMARQLEQAFGDLAL